MKINIRRSLPRMAGVALVLVFLVLLASPLAYRVSEDESTYIYDGQRVAMGQVPFRDFFNFSPPGTYYLLAGASVLAGGRPETAGRYLVLAAALMAWAGCYLLLRRIGGGFPAGLVSALFPVCLYPFAPFSPHHWLGTCSFVWAAVVAARLLDKPTWRWGWVLLGSLAGLTLWFMQTEALFCVVMGSLAALVAGGSLRDVLRRLSLALAGGVGASALLWGPLVVAGGGAQAWRDVVVWPLTHYSRPGNPNDLPLLVDLPGRLHDLWSAPGPGRSPFDVAAALAGTALYAVVGLGVLAALAAAAWALGAAFRRRRLPPGPVTVASLLVIVAVGSFARINPTWVHLIYVVVPAVPFLASALLVEALPGPGTWRALKVASSLLLLMGLAYHGRFLAHHIPDRWELTDVDRVDRESPLNRSLREGGLLRPHDTLVVLPSGGSVYLYTAPAAIGYTYLFPLEDRYNDLHDHSVAAKEIVARRPRLVLIHKVRYKAFMIPGDPLYEVLHDLYTPISETPAVVVLELSSTRPAASPGQPP